MITPMMAYRMVFLAELSLELSPLDVLYFNPPMITITTDTIPEIISRYRMTVLMTGSTDSLLLAQTMLFGSVLQAS